MARFLPLLTWTLIHLTLSSQTPSFNPTLEPTVEPTFEPTIEPTIRTTTVQPTRRPTVYDPTEDANTAAAVGEALVFIAFSFCVCFGACRSCGLIKCCDKYDNYVQSDENINARRELEQFNKFCVYANKMGPSTLLNAEEMREYNAKIRKKRAKNAVPLLILSVIPFGIGLLIVYYAKEAAAFGGLFLIGGLATAGWAWYNMVIRGEFGAGDEMTDGNSCAVNDYFQRTVFDHYNRGVIAFKFDVNQQCIKKIKVSVSYGGIYMTAYQEPSISILEEDEVICRFDQLVGISKDNTSISFVKNDGTVHKEDIGRHRVHVLDRMTLFHPILTALPIEDVYGNLCKVIANVDATWLSRLTQNGQSNATTTAMPMQVNAVQMTNAINHGQAQPLNVQAGASQQVVVVVQQQPNAVQPNGQQPVYQYVQAPVQQQVVYQVVQPAQGIKMTHQ